jgi:hypothetical protein
MGHYTPKAVASLVPGGGTVPGFRGPLVALYLPYEGGPVCRTVCYPPGSPTLQRPRRNQVPKGNGRTVAQGVTVVWQRTRRTFHGHYKGETRSKTWGGPLSVADEAVALELVLAWVYLRHRDATGLSEAACRNPSLDQIREKLAEAKLELDEGPPAVPMAPIVDGGAAGAAGSGGGRGRGSAPAADVAVARARGRGSGSGPGRGSARGRGRGS